MLFVMVVGQKSSQRGSRPVLASQEVKKKSVMPWDFCLEKILLKFFFFLYHSQMISGSLQPPLYLTSAWCPPTIQSMGETLRHNYINYQHKPSTLDYALSLHRCRILRIHVEMHLMLEKCPHLCSTVSCNRGNVVSVTATLSHYSLFICNLTAKDHSVTYMLTSSYNYMYDVTTFWLDMWIMSSFFSLLDEGLFRQLIDGNCI